MPVDVWMSGLCVDICMDREKPGLVESVCVCEGGRKVPGSNPQAAILWWQLPALLRVPGVPTDSTDLEPLCKGWCLISSNHISDGA